MIIRIPVLRFTRIIRR